MGTAIKHIITLGQGTLLAKLDIKNAFRLLPVHPADRHLLAMHWNKQLYIDTCLPFGLGSASKLFNILADLLAWILDQQGVSPILHYLDNFLIMGHSTTCHDNFVDLPESRHSTGTGETRRPGSFSYLLGNRNGHNPHGSKIPTGQTNTY